MDDSRLTPVDYKIFGSVIVAAIIIGLPWIARSLA
jgi:hypothetical protein